MRGVSSRRLLLCGIAGNAVKDAGYVKDQMDNGEMRETTWTTDDGREVTDEVSDGVYTKEETEGDSEWDWADDIDWSQYGFRDSSFLGRKGILLKIALTKGLGGVFYR